MKLTIGHYKGGVTPKAEVKFDGKLVGHMLRRYASGYNPRFGAVWKLVDWEFVPLNGGQSILFAAILGVKHRNITLTKKLNLS